MIFDILSNPPVLISGTTTTPAEGILCAVAFVFALLMALSVHEYAHAYVAYKCGDPTAKMYGRLTINPFKHVDFFGAAMLLVVGFGWAKPVPVNYYNLKNSKRDSALVSVSGILMNIIFAFIYTGLLLLITTFVSASFLLSNRFVYMIVYIIYFYLYYSIFLNIGLALFNILPLYPLDGYRLLESYCKPGNKVLVFLRQYSFYILLFIILLNYLPIVSPFSWYIYTVRNWIFDLFISFWGLFGLV